VPRGNGAQPREYVLRQQLKAIKEELASSTSQAGLGRLPEKISAAKMPGETEKVALKQLERLKVMQPSSAEYTVTRTYLEWLVELPWAIPTEGQAGHPGGSRHSQRRPLRPGEGQEAHPGIPGVRKLKTDKKGPILCLVGPPGAWQDVAGQVPPRAPWGASSMRGVAGWVRDEAEIRDTVAPTWGRCPGESCKHEEGGIEQPVSCSTRSTSWGTTSAGSRSGFAGGLDPEAEPRLLGPLP